MPTNPLIQLPKTESEEEFESMCTDILTDFYKKAFCQYGRNGQNQHGIDIYCDIDNEKRIVVQCKNYLSSKSNNFVKQIESDIKSAIMEFNIDSFVIMTALDRDTKIQDFISSLKSNYSFSIELWFWEDIQEKILSSSHLLQKYYPSVITERDIKTNAKLDELYSVIKELKEQIFLGAKSNTIKDEMTKAKIQEHLNDALHFLELSNESDVGVDNASRAIKRFLSIIDEVENEVINSLIDLVDKCFNYALNTEEKYNLNYVAHKRYVEILQVQNRLSKEIEIGEIIIKKLVADTAPHTFDVAVAYGELASKCLHSFKHTDKLLPIMEDCLRCWVDIIEQGLDYEQVLELATFMDIVAQFFAFDAEKYVFGSDEHNTEIGIPNEELLLSIILTYIYKVTARAIKAGKIWININEKGFPYVYEMLNRSKPFAYQMELVIAKIENKTYISGGIPLIDIAEFCGIISLSLIVGLLKKNVNVPLKHIAITHNTLALIAGEQKRTELQKKLFVEAIEYIESQENGLEKSRWLSIAYHNYGNFSQNSNDLSSAEMYYLYSIDEEKRIVSEYSGKSKFTLAMAYLALANLYEINKKNEKAIVQYKQAVSVFEEIEKTKSDTVIYHKEYIKCLTALAQNYRISWLKSVEETGYFTLDYGNDCMKILIKARSLCIKNYDSAKNEYGSALVKISVEIAQVLAWLEPYLKSAVKNEDLVKEAIQVCEDMIISKSEANYNAFMFVINYQREGYMRAINMPNISNDTLERILTNLQNYFEEIISFLSKNVQNGKVDPKYLFPPALRRVIPTDFMILTNDPPWFFELAHSFQSVYYICFTTLCEIARNAKYTEKVKELYEQAKEFIEIIKDEIGFFMYNTELKKINKFIFPQENQIK